MPPTTQVLTGVNIVDNQKYLRISQAEKGQVGFGIRERTRTVKTVMNEYVAA